MNPSWLCDLRGASLLCQAGVLPRLEGGAEGIHCVYLGPARPGRPVPPRRHRPGGAKAGRPLAAYLTVHRFGASSACQFDRPRPRLRRPPIGPGAGPLCRGRRFLPWLGRPLGGGRQDRGPYLPVSNCKTRSGIRTSGRGRCDSGLRTSRAVAAIGSRVAGPSIGEEDVPAATCHARDSHHASLPRESGTKPGPRF